MNLRITSDHLLHGMHVRSHLTTSEDPAGSIDLNLMLVKSENVNASLDTERLTFRDEYGTIITREYPYPVEFWQ